MPLRCCHCVHCHIIYLAGAENPQHVANAHVLRHHQFGHAVGLRPALQRASYRALVRGEQNRLLAFARIRTSATSCSASGQSAAA